MAIAVNPRRFTAPGEPWTDDTSEGRAAVTEATSSEAIIAGVLLFGTSEFKGVEFLSACSLVVPCPGLDV